MPALSLTAIIDLLLFRTWWRYDPREEPLHAIPYHVFNLLEAAAWFVVAWLVFARWRRHRHGGIEILYAFAFFTFGLTDLREAWALQSWLVWVKLVNLIVLLALRSRVMKQFYPEAKVY